MPEIVLSVDKIASALQISKDQAYRLFHRKDFPALKIGNKLMVRVDHFNEWMEALKLQRMIKHDSN